jgi:hypothetical protein
MNPKMGFERTTIKDLSLHGQSIKHETFDPKTFEGEVTIEHPSPAKEAN